MIEVIDKVGECCNRVKAQECSCGLHAGGWRSRISLLSPVRKRSFSLYRRSVQSVRSGIEEQGDAFKKSDLEARLNDLRELVALVEGRLPEALDDGSPAAEEPKKKSVLA